jgi:signal transduction histidine kinase
VRVKRFQQLRTFVMDEIVDLGIPEDAVRDEDMRRVRIISITTLGLCVVAGVPAIIQFRLLGLSHLAIAGGVTIAAALANLLLLRALRRPILAAHLGLAVLGSLLVFSNVATGGFYDPNFAWLYVLPLGAAALIDLRGAAIWTAILICVTVAFWMLPDQGIELPNRVPESMRAGNSLFNRITAILAMGVIGASFVAGQRRAERQLASAHHDLLAETAYVHLLMHAAVASNEAVSFENAMRQSMRRICETMGWLAGQVYAVGDDGWITPTDAIHFQDPQLDFLAPLAGSQRFPIGVGTVGRSVSERRSQILQVIQEGENPNPLRSAAERAGLRSAITIPVFVNDAVTAVMLFASREKLQHTQRLVEVFSLIGSQLGKVAERAALQDRAHQAQKMEAVGQLAAGVAHEINNPMSYVRTNLHTLREEWAELRSKISTFGDAPSSRQRFDDFQELIEESLEGVERTIAIVRDVKEFSHNGGVDRAHWEIVSMAELLEGAMRVTASQAPSGVRIDCEYEGQGLCRCSPNQIRQVLVNLIVNAIQAVGESGHVRLSTGGDDHQVWARVEDDGIGMSEATRARLFEPFFTTKAVGEGTGLGLSVSYEIVRNHGGEIEVSSEPGAGACFEVRLPAESDEPA